MTSEEKDRLQQVLRELFCEDVRSITSVTGGDIAHAYVITLSCRLVFAKTMADMAMLVAESHGLELIRKTRTIKVPETYGVHALGASAVLLMEYLPGKPATDPDFARLGEALAGLHQITSPFFGLEAENFIGRLPQKNFPAEDWAEFYTAQRLLPQFELAQAKGLLKNTPDSPQILERIRPILSGIKPALLHGDLWSGNYLIHENGTPCLIDPAVYFGHNEVDLAMSRLFGGFGPSFYQAYYRVLPPCDGWQQRQELYQLYYLLVHLNLFGASYAPAVTQLKEQYFH